jgi:hypothetical protein
VLGTPLATWSLACCVAAARCLGTCRHDSTFASAKISALMLKATRVIALATRMFIRLHDGSCLLSVWFGLAGDVPSTDVGHVGDGTAHRIGTCTTWIFLTHRLSFF